MANWISVNDRLPGVRLSIDIPEEQVKVYNSDRLLVYMQDEDGSFIDIGELAVVMDHDNHKLEWNAETYNNGSCTHWMLLPEPPEEGGGKDG